MITEAALVVVRFSAGLRENHELALCVPSDDGSVRVVYADRVAICSQYELSGVLPITHMNLSNKAFVLDCVLGNRDKLNDMVGEYPHVRCFFAFPSTALVRCVSPTDLFPLCCSGSLGSEVHVSVCVCVVQLLVNLDELIAAFRFPTNGVVGSKRKHDPAIPHVDGALTRIDEFIALYHQERDARYKGMIRNITSFRENSRSFNPTSWIKSPLPIAGMQLMDLNNENTMQGVRGYCIVAPATLTAAPALPPPLPSPISVPLCARDFKLRRSHLSSLSLLCIRR